MRNLRITVNGTPYDVQVEELDGAASAPVPAAPLAPKAAAPAPAPAPAAKPSSKAAPAAGSEIVQSPMPGTIVSVAVQAGQEVKKGDVLLVLEAMKMENEIMAPHDATIAGVMVNKGDSVESGTPLVSLR